MKQQEVHFGPQADFEALKAADAGLEAGGSQAEMAGGHHQLGGQRSEVAILTNRHMHDQASTNKRRFTQPAALERRQAARSETDTIRATCGRHSQSPRLVGRVRCSQPPHRDPEHQQGGDR